jgi:UDP-N-acetyl-2-amino-2-deoxyglucuronate dehydrogenase
MTFRRGTNMAKLRVAIIGCGNIFPMHAESIRQAAGKIADLVAVCDIKQNKAIAAGNRYKCVSHVDYREMINQERPDVVHICTPHYLHKEMAVYSASQGVNIFLEKPMGIKVKEALEIGEKVKEKGVKLAVSFQNRYNPSTLLSKDIISSGKLGKIKSAKLILTWCKPDEYYLKSDWKGTWDREGGGVVIDQAIHSLDIFRFLFDSPVEYVDVTTINRMHNIVRVEDEASGVIMFKSGAFANLYVMNHYSYDNDLTIEIHGEKGLINIVKDSASARFYKGGKTLRASPKKNEYIDYGDGVKDYWGVCHSIAIKKFYEAIINKTAVDINEDEGIETQWMIDAIYESGRKGKRIFMDEFKKKNSI